MTSKKERLQLSYKKSISRDCKGDRGPYSHGPPTVLGCLFDRSQILRRTEPFCFFSPARDFLHRPKLRRQPRVFGRLFGSLFALLFVLFVLACVTLSTQPFSAQGPPTRDFKSAQVYFQSLSLPRLPLHRRRRRRPRSRRSHRRSERHLQFHLIPCHSTRYIKNRHKDCPLQFFIYNDFLTTINNNNNNTPLTHSPSPPHTAQARR